MIFSRNSTVPLLSTETLDLTASNDSAANPCSQNSSILCDAQVAWAPMKDLTQNLLTAADTMDSTDGDIFVPTFTTLLRTTTTSSLDSFDLPEQVEPLSIKAFTSVSPSTTTIRPRSSVTLGVTIIPDTCTDAATCNDIPPPRSLIIFYIIYIVVLLLTFLGYLVFIVVAIVRQWPSILDRRRKKAATKAARKKETSSRGPRIESMRPPPVIIGEARRRSRDTERSSADARIGTHEHVESYEMDEFHAPHQRHHSRSQSPHVAWVDASNAAPSRPYQSDSEQRRTRREAMLWDHLKDQNINDVDDETRIAALKQLRKSQMPSQTNFGDDNVWSPIATTEELRRRYRDRRQQQ